MAWLIALLLGVLGLAFVIDVRRKNTFNRKTVRHHPGEDKNITMGDNRYSSGGE
ncbi:hypothetical protein [Bacillus sp. V2I10]|uniref:hypothetical protein n=1 Tax=Bacillus sp. V2I10 TaxID=3042276 RepID=UPI0027886C33|nr:hypothetical protein [Bacillus sp. V2I10]MDQ0858842.1 hypothetical protein [Bacillus sp. V2I10]